jgi:hypothetical protein
MTRGGKRQTSFDAERAREAARRSVEARRRKRDEPEPEPLTDREQAMAALRRALDGQNHAAMVAAAKALLEFDTSDPRGPMDVVDARAEFEARLDKIIDHRRRAGEVCPACGGRGYVSGRPGPVPRDHAGGNGAAA